jgi:glutamyl aminopeptidase
MFNFELFKEICETRAISGDEKDMVALLRKYYLENDVEIIYDNLGSMVAHKKSKKENAYKVLVVAHSDEIGLMVNGLNSNGTIKANAVGGINHQILLGNRVHIKNDLGECLLGIVSTTTSSEKISDLEIDLGYDSKEDLIRNHISIGNSIYLEGNAYMLNDKRVVAKAIDDRYGCFLTVELLKELNGEDLDIDLYIGVSVQEEVGCRGAMTIANKINPDFAIVLDCSPSDPKNGNGFLGKGVLLRVKDANMLSFKSVINYQKEMCKEVDVPCQPFISYGGTDAGMIHKNADGVVTMTHCICAKNLHSTSTIIDIDDYLSAKKSLLHILKTINNDKIDELRAGNR